MNISTRWLREWVSPDVSDIELSEKLTMAGLEVDQIAPVAPPFDGLVVGHVVSCGKHPNADKLYVVKLDDGNNGRTICAGIKEFYSVDQLVGMTVVFVANLKPRPLRGITSEGMMLAADDGNGQVKLVTIDGEIGTGSTVR